LLKRKVSSLEGKIESLWAMDDESGESMEPIEEVPLIRLDAILTCDQKLTRLPVFAQKRTMQRQTGIQKILYRPTKVLLLLFW